MLVSCSLPNVNPENWLSLQQQTLYFCFVVDLVFGLFVASDFLTTICHLAIINVCVIIILSIGNIQTSILLLFPVLICWTYDYDEWIKCCLNRQQTWMACFMASSCRFRSSARCLSKFSWNKPAKLSAIGRFSEAGLHQWMPFVIFCARSRERLQHDFRADFWVGIASCCV